MRINKIEAVGVAVSIMAMVLLLWILQFEDTSEVLSTALNDEQAALVVNSEGGDAALAEAIDEGSSASGRIERLIIDDIVFGQGEEVTVGDQATVHYIGTLQNGQQFDNSYVRGEPFTFTLGEGRVIPGWEEGVKGMKVGGQRVLVVPSELAYGSKGAGPIPANATLVFAIELLEIN